MSRKRTFILSGLCLLMLFIGAVVNSSRALAQSPVSATPARISIPTATSVSTEISEATPTWTPTPTPIGAILLEAKNEANVRAAPDINSDKLGVIRPGEVYPIIGRSFRWLQFQYDPSPSGIGWVYDELVTITGDTADIVDLNANTLPTVDTSSVNATQTWEAVTQTPGGLLTATAESRIIEAPGSGTDSTPISSTEIPGGIAGEGSQLLPTFTYPPDIVAQAPLEGGIADLTATPGPGNATNAASNGVAPIVPIVVLGGLGLIGLLISSARK